MQEYAKTISGKSFSVRVLLSNGQTMFSANDILQICGIKYPIKWISRTNREKSSEFCTEKLPYPVMTTYGLRMPYTHFCNKKTATHILDLVDCCEEGKRFLMKEVFPFTFEIEKDAGIAEEKAQEKTEKAPDIRAISCRLDEILIELIQIRKQLYI